jgi:dihydrofolate synthase
LQDNPLALVVAMGADKDHRAVVAALRRAAPCTVVFTSVPIAGSYSRAAPPGAHPAAIATILVPNVRNATIHTAVPQRVGV